MDLQLDLLELSSYGVVDTSLEEVFLKVTEQAARSDGNRDQTNKNLKYHFANVLAIFGYCFRLS